MIATLICGFVAMFLFAGTIALTVWNRSIQKKLESTEADLEKTRREYQREVTLNKSFVESVNYWKFNGKQR